MELFQQYFIDVIKNKYALFEGRARRKEYWMFTLFNALISIVLTIVFSIIKMPYLAYIYSLAVLIPGIALSIRRLHDVGKSGWFLLIAFIPLVGSLYLLYLFVLEGEATTNQYGPDPKAAERS